MIHTRVIPERKGAYAMSSHEVKQENECKDIEVRVVGKDSVDFYVKNRLMSMESAEKLYKDIGKALKSMTPSSKSEAKAKPEPKVTLADDEQPTEGRPPKGKADKAGKKGAK